MRKRLITLAVVLACSAPVCADYIADRKAAMDLVKAGKNEEAMTAFIEMAETTTNAAQESDALEQAAMCAHRQKEHDQAMQLARQIPLVPMSALSEKTSETGIH